MKRSPLKRRTPLKRSGRVNPRNEERAAKRKERDFGPLAEYIRTLPYDACHAEGRTQAAHVKSRGSGGHAYLENGDGNLIPLCVECHALQHLKGWGALRWVCGESRTIEQLEPKTSVHAAAELAAHHGDVFATTEAACTSE